jgi:hypothetical protein
MTLTAEQRAMLGALAEASGPMSVATLYYGSKITAVEFVDLAHGGMIVAQDSRDPFRGSWAITEAGLAALVGEP